MEQNICNIYNDLITNIVVDVNCINLKILSFNVYKTENKNGISIQQQKYLNNSGADIMCLQECDDQTEKLFIEYKTIKIESHQGFIYLLVNNKLEPNFENLYMEKGIIVSKVNTNKGILILGSMHLYPSYGNSEFRENQLKNAIKWIRDNKYKTYPIVIGGDTNMRDNENYFVTKSIFDDIYFNSENEYCTWPNRELKGIKLIDNTGNFRFDRIFVRNCNFPKMKILNTFDSDHLMILSVGQINLQNMIELPVKMEKPKKVKTTKNKSDSDSKEEEKLVTIKKVVSKNVKIK